MHNIPEKQISHLHRGRNLKLNINQFFSFTMMTYTFIYKCALNYLYSATIRQTTLLHRTNYSS
jgi:hypothetical protein